MQDLFYQVVTSVVGMGGGRSIKGTQLSTITSLGELLVPTGLWAFALHHQPGQFGGREVLERCQGLGFAEDLRPRWEALGRAGQLLRPFQHEAVLAGLLGPLGRGVVKGPTGCGKTHIAAGLIAVGGGEWLYLVSNKELAAQTEASFMKILPPMAEACGTLTGEDAVSVRCCSYGSLNESAYKVGYSGVIIDECHAVAAPTRMSVVWQLSTLFMVGLSATPYDRQDEKNAIVAATVGPVVHDIDPVALENDGYLSPGKVTQAPVRSISDTEWHTLTRKGRERN